jgi:hypothetical protein
MLILILILIYILILNLNWLTRLYTATARDRLKKCDRGATAEGTTHNNISTMSNFSKVKLWLDRPPQTLQMTYGRSLLHKLIFLA